MHEAFVIIAHGPRIVAPGFLWHAWTWDPAVVLGLLAAGGAYAYGVRRAWRIRPGRGLPLRRVVAFYLGLGAIGIALVSPLDSLAATLFSAHMVQHLVLVLVAPPLLVYGTPLPLSLLWLPAPARRTLNRATHRQRAGPWGSALRNPVAIAALQTAAMWTWHLPVCYQAALRNDAVHLVEHACFFLTAMLLWSAIIGRPPRPGAGYPSRLALVFVTGLQSGALGAILTFATTLAYPLQASGARTWGLRPLEDQQLAGAIMWIPAGVVYLGTLVVLFVRWLNDMDRRMEAGGEPSRAIAYSGDRP
jgi:putative membrane protein